MSVLSEAKLVNVERKGRFVFYSVNKETIDLISSGISSLKTGSKKTSKVKAAEADDNEKFKKGKKKKKKDKSKKKKKDWSESDPEKIRVAFNFRFNEVMKSYIIKCDGI